MAEAAPAISAPLPNASPDESFDALFDELSAQGPTSPRSVPSADPVLDVLLDEIAGVNEAIESPGPDPLDPLFAEADGPVAASEPAACPSPPLVRSRPRRASPLRRLALGLCALVLLLGSNVLSYQLGRQSGAPVDSHHAPEPAPKAPAEPAAAPVVPVGVERFIGLSGDQRVEGRTIFSQGDVRAAIEQLDGGPDLIDDLTAADPHLVLTAPIALTADWLNVFACNRQNCASDAFALRYNAIEGLAELCRTRPYVGGSRMFYIYDSKGMREVPGCPGQASVLDSEHALGEHQVRPVDHPPVDLKRPA